MCKSTIVKPASRKEKSNGQGQGMNWITQHKRLAIYLRDGLACAYCGASVEDGIKLTLDHIKPYSKGGTNEANNLVTCCDTCNSSRGARAVTTFAKAAAEYRGVDADCILKNIKNATRRALDVAAAKAMIAERGSCAKAIATK